MRILPDDPRLTAYALGEMEPAEQAAIEAALTESPEARAELEEIRRAAALLSDELRSETAPALTASQRAAIISRNGQATFAPKLNRTSRLFIGFASLAACLIAAVGLTWQKRPLDFKEWGIRHSAVKEASPAPPLAANHTNREVSQTTFDIAPTASSQSPVQIATNESRKQIDEMKKDFAEAQERLTGDQRATLSRGGTVALSYDLAGGAKQSRPAAVGSIVGQPASDPRMIPTPDSVGDYTGGAWALSESATTSPSQSMLGGGGGLGAGGGSPGTDSAIFSSARQYQGGAEWGRVDQTVPASPPIAGSLGGVIHGRSEAEKQVRAFYTLHRRNDPNEPQPPPAARACTMPATLNTESYKPIADNPFLRVTDSPLSTFSIDVDTASYANTRRFINSGRLPPADAVRIEELINYFTYDYPQPGGDAPFSVNAEMAECPWSPRHRLLRIGLRGKSIAQDRQPATNLVFLIDVSGSMQPENKLPLLQKSLSMLVRKLNANDRVAIVVYAGASGLVLPSTTGDRQDTILAAIDRLNAGGSTNGAAGIQLAYDTARANFMQGGVNRVILATDGDFNVGITSEGDLGRLIEEQAKSGVFLSVLGFGMDNLKDSTLETLADKGNGNYAYIDTPREARKALVEQLAGTLFTIAKDVKIQIEFNPAKVGAYRLIGYENRILAAQDFNDDRKDAGEIGAGHTVTALYEIVPVGESINAPGIDPLKYQQPQAVAVAPGGAVTASNEACTVKLRYKQPDGQTSRLLEVPVTDLGNKFAAASGDFKFAAAVAGFGMQLRQSPFKGDWTLAAVQEVAQESRGNDITEYRSEFIDLVKKARGLMGQAGN